jgi:vacuolar iron transporter family protein
MSWHDNPNFIHHQDKIGSGVLREVVFGMEDGMVSTMGAITGIAAATGNQFTVVLSGLVIIGVESISMAVGSYLSNKSERDMNERKLAEERYELARYPQEEKEELVGMYKADGWPPELAKEMANTAAKNKDLFLKEMAYRELKVFPDEKSTPVKNGVAMGVAYIVGGFVPVLPYFAAGKTVTPAIPVSIIITLVGLFMLGAITTRYSKRLWWKAGLEMLALASVAAFIGYAIGQVVEKFWL